MEPGEESDRPNKGLSPTDDADLVLYGVAGLERGGVSSHSGVSFGHGRQKRVVRLSESLQFCGPDGGSITVTSQHRGDEKRLEETRASAPMNPFMASPRGRAAHAAWNRVDAMPRPVDVEWSPITILVDGQSTPFELCDLGDGYWAAVGLVPDATITIDGRKIPVSAVSLERLASRELPPPIAPDLGERCDVVLQNLEDRFDWPNANCSQMTGWGAPISGIQGALAVSWLMVANEAGRCNAGWSCSDCRTRSCRPVLAY